MAELTELTQSAFGLSGRRFDARMNGDRFDRKAAGSLTPKLGQSIMEFYGDIVARGDKKDRSGIGVLENAAQK